MIGELLKNGRDKYRFIENCRILFDFWEKHLDRPHLILRVLRENAKYTKLFQQSIISGGSYSIDLKQVHPSVSDNTTSYTLTLTNKVRPSSLLLGVDNSKSDMKSVSSCGTPTGSVYGKNDLSDILIGGGSSDCSETFDMQVNDEIFNKKFKSRLSVGGPDTKEREELIGFFMFNTISDEARKQIWKTKISNNLGISSDLFETLKARLREDGVKKSIEKVICDDLNRSLPEYKEYPAGLEMYDSVKTLLSIWHLYRPDFGYVQGMSYIMVMLFYYYDEFECFVLFCNLILTRPIFSSCYSFDLLYV